MKSLRVPIPPPCLAGFAAQPLECAFDGLPSTRGVGFISLHARELGRFGFALPQ